MKSERMALPNTVLSSHYFMCLPVKGFVADCVLDMNLISIHFGSVTQVEDQFQEILRRNMFAVVLTFARRGNDNKIFQETNTDVVQYFERTASQGS